MRSGCASILAVWMIAAIPAFGQSPASNSSAPAQALPESKAAPPMAAPTEGSGVPLHLSAADPLAFWVRADYLAYWVKSAPAPISILTGDTGIPTTELLNANERFGMLSGFRIGMGGWLDANYSVGLEANVFALMQRSTTFSASSDAAGNPILTLPFINQTPGAVGYTMVALAVPGLFAGNVQVESTLKLWGTEANGTFALYRGSGFEVVGLAGARYLDLQERLTVNTLSTDIVTDPVTVLNQSDMFGTRNQFYGGQLGGRVNWQGERLGFDLTGKFALGGTHQSIDIQGLSTQTGPGGVNGTFPGGFFTQPSNMGRFTGGHLAFVPTIEMKMYAMITPNLRAFVGYDFIYWSSVVRPGGQVDRNVNVSQSIIYGSGTLSGPAAPMPMFTRTDFWAQGISLGLELRF